VEELEFMVFKEEKSDIQSEWDKQTPIVSKGKVVTVFLNDEIYEPGAYNELCYTLENTVADEVRLYMNNGGGQLDSMLSIIASMERCGCEITGVLSGTVASAATMIALQCDKLEVADYTAFMIHSASGGTSGKSHETKAYMEFNDKNLKEIFNAIYKGFLTESEIKKVLDGKDMWMNKDEVITRFEKVKNG
jgi:ATP-dependent protease ClpP protease subunit